MILDRPPIRSDKTRTRHLQTSETIRSVMQLAEQGELLPRSLQSSDDNTRTWPKQRSDLI